MTIQKTFSEAFGCSGGQQSNAIEITFQIVYPLNCGSARQAILPSDTYNR
jgi:hypothetical protein